MDVSMGEGGGGGGGESKRGAKSTVAEDKEGRVSGGREPGTGGVMWRGIKRRMIRGHATI